MASWEREPQRLAGDWLVYRQVGRGYPAMWHPGSERQPTLQPPARWHDGDAYAQYCALDTDGAWAELARWEGIRSEARRVEYRVNLWQLRVVDTQIADLRNYDRIAACGLDPAMFVEDDHAACRRLAAELRDAGYRGLLAPSASLPGGANLTLFGRRRELRGLDADNRRPDVYVRVSLAAEGAAPPRHVVDATRFHGDPPLRLQAWLDARGRRMASDSERGEAG